MFSKSKTIIFAGLLSAAAMSSFSTSASAGGIGGDILNHFVPGAGTVIDELHRGFKQANPNYGKWEEEMTNRTREQIGLPRHCEPLYNKWGDQVGCQ